MTKNVPTLFKQIYLIYKLKGAELANESEKKDSEKSITDRLGINEKTDRTSLNDLTNNDGSEDPGAELDTEFSNITNKNNKHHHDENNMTENKIDKPTATQPTSGTPPKGEELDAFTNNASKKKKLEETHPKPQADEVMNPELNSENDI